MTSSASTPLQEKIKKRIVDHGPMSVAEYMSMCLSDPEHGYYMRQQPFGTKGDFTTAPEISQLFGELIGAWFVHQYLSQDLKGPVHLVEMGPGRGTLMKDILRVVSLRPQMLANLQIHLAETSPSLRKAQRKLLKAYTIKWHDTLETIPEGPTLLVANELFDTLPIHQYQLTEQGWRERCVGLDNEDNLTFGIGAGTLSPADVAKANLQAKMGDTLELSPASNAIAKQIGQRIRKNGGAALLIDYGYAKTATGDTFQALKKHEYVSTLDHCGEADLTAHVNFQALANAALTEGAKPHGPIGQGQFLLGLGLLERAGQLGAGKSTLDQDQIRKDVERLAADDQMGALFKVLCITNTSEKPIPFQQ
ncbi:TetR family transcriptional regulator [Pseudovibrio japonicus]|uniref:TetR family transcriptional regulator n=1 Tax=Pseudovibrio japonicus TaxID=366534 RepID=A0ABQ3EGX4_9HYPH|nr:SAM-dependent methyltransferase [Pseudovibrio japonicus]GHB30482.1 TetR family transcriptional regulator [Pseudovibrio japonicus]